MAANRILFEDLVALMNKPQVAVLLINTGSPAAPEADAVREYLAEFLSDPRIIEMPQWKWQPILRGIILRKRPAESAKRYRSVWTEEGSPLITHTRRTAERLSGRLSDAPHVKVVWAMRYGKPAVADVLDELRREGVERIVVMPMFAQRAAQTTSACFDAVLDHLRAGRIYPALRFVPGYHVDEGYVEALAEHLRAHWAKAGDIRETGGHLVLSFHGIPKASVEVSGDPYEKECRETAEALAKRLGLTDADWSLAYQSRFGRDEWLRPYAIEHVEELARKGVKRVDVFCPGFAADCLETIEEINEELRGFYLAQAGEDAVFHYVPCLNASDEAVRAYERIIRRMLGDWI